VLSKSGVHSVRALVVLAELPAGEYQGASAIADQTDAPRNYLGKLLQILSRRGLVESQKGLGGGFRLARAPENISLFDVVDAIEGVSRWTECILGSPSCSDNNPCAVHERWAPVRDAYLDLLKMTKLDDLTPSGRLQS
jgi:Rrf2 family iron-sulfur cluster assembly transcriptional regulator